MGEKRPSKACGLDDFRLIFVNINRKVKKGAGKLCVICLDLLLFLLELGTAYVAVPFSLTHTGHFPILSLRKRQLLIPFVPQR
jgi:hypothetical protein